jgi:hypothetical protein
VLTKSSLAGALDLALKRRGLTVTKASNLKAQLKA